MRYDGAFSLLEGRCLLEVAFLCLIRRRRNACRAAKLAVILGRCSKHHRCGSQEALWLRWIGRAILEPIMFWKCLTLLWQLLIDGDRLTGNGFV